jgi:DNA polymerase IV
MTLAAKRRNIPTDQPPGFCRECLADAVPGPRCNACGSPRLVRHPEIDALSIAHIDCDAFYAAIEKRDNPSLEDVPLIVGGGKRGVVATACYVARTYGVKSAMPMFKALKLCANAVVVRPDMAKYVAVSRQVRALMLEVTPLVEPLSIDEAFMDLSGTARLHGMSPARSLAHLSNRIRNEIGITVSVGLSANKFLAKVASDLEKPRGFTVLGASEALDFLASKPVTFIWGVGKAAEQRLHQEGFRLVGDLQRAEPGDLMRLFGSEGLRLSRLSRGLDARSVNPDHDQKVVSAETTFDDDIASLATLERKLWRLSEKVSARLKAKGLTGSTVTLKLKSADFRIRTRARSLASPTALADAIYRTGRELLARETDGTRFRLIGIGVSALEEGSAIEPDLIGDTARVGAAEDAVDRLRARFGTEAVVRGLAFPDRPKTSV